MRSGSQEGDYSTLKRENEALRGELERVKGELERRALAAELRLSQQVLRSCALQVMWID